MTGPKYIFYDERDESSDTYKAYSFLKGNEVLKTVEIRVLEINNQDKKIVYEIKALTESEVDGKTVEVRYGVKRCCPLNFLYLIEEEK